MTPLPRPYAALSTKFLRDPVPVHEANLNYYRIQKTMVDTERLAERGTLLYRLGSELIASTQKVIRRNLKLRFRILKKTARKHQFAPILLLFEL